MCLNLQFKYYYNMESEYKKCTNKLNKAHTYSIQMNNHWKLQINNISCTTIVFLESEVKGREVQLKQKPITRETLCSLFWHVNCEVEAQPGEHYLDSQTWFQKKQNALNF